MSEAETPIPASDLPTRFVMGVVLVAVACAAVYFGGWPFRLLVLAAAAVMLVEWGDMHRVPRIHSYIGVVILALNLLVLSEFLFPADEMEEVISPDTFAPAWTALAVSGGAAILLGLIARRPTMAGGYLYVALPSFALLLINWAWWPLVFWMMVVTWSTDILAYFAGRTIGGPKLAPRISPNKTWAGLLGGVVGAALFGWLVADRFDLGAPFLYLGALMAVVAQAGDLYESWLKRRAGVKDSGTILPGHGGALDRLDGFLPVILLTLIVLMAGLWTA